MFCKCSFAYLFILILCTSCRTSKIISRIKSSDGSEYVIRAGTFRSCDYVRASNKKGKSAANDFSIDFECSPGWDFHIRKGVYDDKGNYITSFHAVTDTTEKVKFFDTELMPELQAVRLKRGIKPVSSHDSFLLNAINNELFKRKYKHTMPEGIGDKIIGWVSSE
jgi:hypothetical protein